MLSLTKTAKNHIRPEKNSRNRTIDFMKGICILFVIITHCNFSEKSRLQYLFPFWIDMAVPAFMILSGYVNMAAFSRQNISCLQDAYHFRIIKSLTRFTIPYIIFYIAELLLARHFNTFSLSGFGFRAFLTGGTGPGSYYYPIMMQFVLIFPLIFILIEKYNSLGFIWGGVINISFELLQHAYGLNEECYRLLIFRYLFLIFFGAFLYKNKEREIKLRWGIISVVTGTLFILATQYKGYEPLIIIYWKGTSLFASLFIIPILSIIIKKANLNCVLVELFGKASFHICLVQIIFYVFFAEYFYSLYDNRFLHLIIALTICLSTGCLFWVVEQGLNKWIVQKEKHIFDKIMNMRLSEKLDNWLLK